MWVFSMWGGFRTAGSYANNTNMLVTGMVISRAYCVSTLSVVVG